MRSTVLLSLALCAGCAALPSSAPEGGNGVTAPEPAPQPSPQPIAAAGTTASDPAAVRAAVARALPFVESEGVAWMEGRVSVQDGQGCVSCHHVGYALWSHAEARRAGAGGGGEAIAALERTAEEFLSHPTVPRTLSAGSFLMAQLRPAPQLVDALIDLQTDAGGWEAKGQFPTQRRPIAESDAVATMVALIVLDRAAFTASAGDLSALDRARRRGAAWLAESEPGESVEWQAVRLVLAGAVESPESLEPLRAALAARQRADGGWGWLADDDSDAFSTGQAVYALAATAVAGSPGDAGSAAVAEGTAFLLAAQDDDGSWRVPSAAISREPSAGKDVIYHFWASAWATLGLARSLLPPVA